jgi:hypothetical protein
MSLTIGSGFGSGSDPYPDPAIFGIDLQNAKKNKLKKKFFCLLLFEGTFTSFSKIKKSKRSHKTVIIKGFSYYNILIIEGSGSGSIPLTSGSRSGSRGPKTCGSGSGFVYGSGTLVKRCSISRVSFYKRLQHFKRAVQCTVLKTKI